MKSMKWNKLFLMLMLINILFMDTGNSLDDLDENTKTTDEGLFPHVFNLATRALVTANATCGEVVPEVYCHLVEHVPDQGIDYPQCQICDSNSKDERERHPIENVIDGTNSWWQSPSIANGMQYHQVTVTLDLGQVFQVAYIILKAANSPRPGNWVLERSLDGETYQPWQYYAVSDPECLRAYGKWAAERMETYRSDDEVICTSYYSSLEPLRDGEIHTSLINGRPSALNPSETLMDFMSARFIRFRFQRIRTLHADLMSPMYNTAHDATDPIVSRRYFYSIKDISVGGHCICHGHARECIHRSDNSPDQPVMRCVCQHNTCGESCNHCCPGYHQDQWRPGIPCKACNCHNRADECYYDPAVEGRSLDASFLYRGGGVCIDCRDNTEGINCERCVDGYYRPEGMLPEYPNHCTECNCDPVGTIPDTGNSTGLTPCIKDDRLIDIGVMPGSCACREGYAGLKCDRCARGYHGYPTCQPCPCSAAGSINEDPCEGPCICKPNVEGVLCDKCVPGTFNLNERDPLGCTMCFCFGITTECTSSPWPLVQITTMDNWFMTRLDMRGYAYPQRISTYAILADHQQISQDLASQQYYFLAPKEYTGNKLAAYGGVFKMTFSWRTNYDIPAPDISRRVIIILEGYSMRLARWFSRDPIKREDTISFIMTEAHWYHLPEDLDPLGSISDPPGRGASVSQAEFMNALSVMRRLLIGALQDPPQISVLLKDVSMDVVIKEESQLAELLKSVEECSCPSTYEGLSCESCTDGYRRKGGIIYGGDCEVCNCNNHSTTCDDITGECLNCEDNTYGPHCEFCLPGYYGNASSVDGCVLCACPLLEASNNFSPSCLPDFDNDYICDQCPPGYEGDKCERCADGYFGNPLVPGGLCQPCFASCRGNVNPSQPGNCHPVTGECLICTNNAAGSRCERCADGFYGDAIKDKSCRACDCDVDGSTSTICDHQTGLCQCRANVTGKSCDQCQVGFWNLASGNGCQSCDCNALGSLADSCDLATGQCRCKEGVTGLRCDQCKAGYWGFSPDGCQACTCDRGECDSVTGECFCPPNTIKPACKECLPLTWRTPDGCLPCNCSKHGSFGADCDTDTGQCRCHKSYGGLRCDQCPRGYSGFPACRRCKCSPLGTDPASCKGKRCDCSDDGQCVCKENTGGLRCDRCKPGTFGLSTKISSGCLSCFCSGVSSQCDQAEYVYSKLKFDPDSAKEVSAASMSISKRTREGLEVSSLDVRMNVSYVAGLLGLSDVYWALPSTFAGSKVTSYGGSLRYKVTTADTVANSSLHRSSNSPYLVLVSSDLVLEGAVAMKERNTATLMFKIDLLETHFTKKDTSAAPSRSEFMWVLSRLQAVYIRANIWGDVQTAILSKVSLDVGVPGRPTDGYPQASSVEQCKCPLGYMGTSCEKCSDGYVRHSEGMHRGTCQPCECNGHAARCEEGTGACLDCQHNTSGLQCERCADGYYGDATQGTSTDCKQCACPMTRPDNNFSPICELSDDGSHNCTACPEGYTGRFCQSCQARYFGDPLSASGSCLPCDCNGLGSVSLLCDIQTGLCDCREGVRGDKCNECQPGFVLKEAGCISCFADTCARILLDEVDAMQASFNVSFNTSTFVVVPRSRFLSLRNQSQDFSITIEDYKLDISKLDNRISSSAKLLERREEDVSIFLEKVQGLLAETDDVFNNSNSTLKRGHTFRQNIAHLLRTLNGSYDELQGLILVQGKLPTASNTELMTKARDILRDFAVTVVDAEKELMLATSLYDRAVSSASNSTHLQQALNNVTGRLWTFQEGVEEMLNFSEASENGTRRAVAINNRTLTHQKAVQDHVVSIASLDGKVTGDLKTASAYTNESWININAANKFFQEYRMDHQEFSIRLRPWMNMSAELQIGLLELTALVSQAMLHSQGLWILSASLESLLQPTKHIAENALQAARAYSDIINAIDRAENASVRALLAADDAQNKTFLRDGQTLAEGALSLRVRSEDHLSEADGLQDDLTTLEKNLKRAAKKVKKTGKKLSAAERDMHDITRVLPPLESTDISSRASYISSLSVDILDISSGLMNQSLLYIDKFSQLQDVHAKVKDNIDEVADFATRASDEVESAQAVVDDFYAVTTSLEDKAARYTETESNVRGDIATLREKIRMAKNEVSKIWLALRSEGNCSRVYRPSVSPSAYNSLSLMVDISRPNNQLFYLGGGNSDFFSIETIDFQVVFKWNVGSGVGAVSSTVIMLPGSWYRVKATRIGQTGFISVEDVENPSDTPAESGTAPPGSTILDVGDGSVLYIGGVPSDQKLDTVQTQDFEGCISDVVFDGKAIGLWNYESMQGECHGCMKSPFAVKKEAGYGFDGTGYATVIAPASLRAELLYIALDIRTLSQNALLLFMSSADQADFVSLELEGGRIVTKLDLGEGAAVGKSAERINNNTWHFVSLTVVSNASSLYVNNIKVASISTKSSADGLTLQPFTKIFVGGLPFDFRMSRDVGTDSFRGCIRNFHLYRTSQDLIQPGQSFGITENCAPRKVERSIGLDGSGPVALRPVPLGGNADLTVTFTTLQENVVILAAGDLQDRTKRDINFDAVDVSYAIMLVEGLLQVQVNAGQGRLTLGSRKSDGKLNDGRPHVVLLEKNVKRIRITVDDVHTRSGRLPGTNVLIAARSPLYIGGIRSGVSSSKLVQSLPWFSGCIENLLIMGELLAFNDAIDASSASIGYCGPLTLPPPRPTEVSEIPGSPEELMKRPEPSIPSCHTAAAPEFIPYGLRFGITPESYAAVDIVPAQVSKVFTMSIELKTTAESGLIFYMADRSERNYCVLVILKGFLLFTFNLGSGSVNVLTDSAIDDGHWHVIHLTRNRKTGTIQVDGRGKHRVKTTAGGASRLNVVSPLYIGGLPKDFQSGDFGGESSFQGCIRRFELNNRPIDLPDDSTVTRGTSLCYTDTESGAFFPGEGYIVQESNMLLRRELTIALEFKTSSKDGVLAGLANRGNAYIILELKNLAINLWSSNGQETFLVTFNNPPTISLCDNQWHSIDIRITLIQLALRVDGNNTIATHRMPGSTGGRYSLFAGGISEGFLRGTWVPFQGCIRNFSFNGVVQNFRRAVEITGAVPDECPRV